jgi:hypothetical protein
LFHFVIKIFLMDIHMWSKGWLFRRILYKSLPGEKMRMSFYTVVKIGFFLHMDKIKLKSIFIPSLSISLLLPYSLIFYRAFIHPNNSFRKTDWGFFLFFKFSNGSNCLEYASYPQWHLFLFSFPFHSVINVKFETQEKNPLKTATKS